MNTYIEIGGQINGMFRRNIIIDKKDKDKAIKKYNFKDTYSTIYEYDDVNQDTANYRAPLYIDLDADNLERDFEKLKRDVLLIMRKIKTTFKLDDNNIELYFSGSKGFHIIIPYQIFGLDFDKGIDAIYKLIAIELKSYTITKSVDTKIYEHKRLFREVNSINSKTGLHKVGIKLNDLRVMNYLDLTEYASEERPLLETNKEYKPESRQAFDIFVEDIKNRQKRSINHRVARNMLANKELLPCVKYILQNGAIKGGRNNTAMALASALYQRDSSNEEKILDIMKQWNETKLDEPLSDRELENTVKSAYKNVMSGKRYGCSAFIGLDICVKGCPVRKM